MRVEFFLFEKFHFGYRYSKASLFAEFSTKLVWNSSFLVPIESYDIIELVFHRLLLLTIGIYWYKNSNYIRLFEDPSR